jgi:putative FmdB family regulatory protein
MPIYEYICLDCKKEYEILSSFNEADQPTGCDNCGGENVKRKLSVFYAQSGGHAVSGAGGGGCSSCGGGNCGSCGV